MSQQQVVGTKSQHVHKKVAGAYCSDRVHFVTVEHVHTTCPDTYLIVYTCCDFVPASCQFNMSLQYVLSCAGSLNHPEDLPRQIIYAFPIIIIMLIQFLTEVYR